MRDVLVMGVCGASLLVGVVLTLRWLRRPMTPPTGGRPVTVAGWWAALGVTTSLLSLLLVVGPGGRLAMRLLAATSPDALGQITEASEVVGRISVVGTLSFYVFGAAGPAIIATVAYLLLRRWLPRGAVGGLALGGLLLVVLATRDEPLREDNLDFALVGPGWLAVLVFGALTLLTGVATAVFAGRLSSALPLLSRDRAAVRTYAVLLGACVLTPPLGWALLVVAALAVAVLVVALTVVARAPGVVAWWGSRRVTLLGRVLLGGVALLALPGTVGALAGILD